MRVSWSVASKSVIAPTPDFPAIADCQVDWTSLPNGLRQPMPVMTIRVFMVVFQLSRLSIGPGQQIGQMSAIAEYNTSDCRKMRPSNGAITTENPPGSGIPSGFLWAVGDLNSERDAYGALVSATGSKR